jgi:AraC-like DNA-binding protein
MAGLSRTQLYRVFEAQGGVARAVQRERLRAIARTLADPEERRPVAQVAEAFGMPDASAFSRVFRREYGVTPRAFREAALLGLGLPQGGSRAEGGFACLLRGLGC